MSTKRSDWSKLENGQVQINGKFDGCGENSASTSASDEELEEQERMKAFQDFDGYNGTFHDDAEHEDQWEPEGATGASIEEQDRQLLLVTHLESQPQPAWKRALGLILMALSACVFATMSLIVHLAGEKFATFEIASFRFLVQAAFAGIGLLIQREKPFGIPKNRKWLLLRGILGSFGMCFAFWAFTHLPLADASTIIFTNPVVTAILARLILKESFSQLEGLSAFLCLVGVTFISQPTFIFGSSAVSMDESIDADRQKNLEFAGLTFTTTRWFGLLMAILCSFFAATSFLTVRMMGAKESTNVIVLWYGIIGLIIAPIFALSGQYWVWPSNFLEWAMVLGIGAMGYLGQLLMNRGLQIEKAGPAALMRNLDIVLAFVYQMSILHINPTPWSIGGAVIILVCTSVVGIAKARKGSAPSKPPQEQGNDSRQKAGKDVEMVSRR